MHTVTIRARELEAPWGSGPTRPAIVSVTIADDCPRCGGPRGVPVSTRQHEDGETYWVSTWTNPCGHIDAYTEVAREAGLVKKETARA